MFCECRPRGLVYHTAVGKSDRSASRGFSHCRVRRLHPLLYRAQDMFSHQMVMVRFYLGDAFCEMIVEPTCAKLPPGLHGLPCADFFLTLYAGDCIWQWLPQLYVGLLVSCDLLTLGPKPKEQYPSGMSRPPRRRKMQGSWGTRSALHTTASAPVSLVQ